MLRLSIFLCFLYLYPTASDKIDSSLLVNDAVEALRAASANSSDDFLRDLSSFGPKVALFTKSITPISALVTKNINWEEKTSNEIMLKVKPKPETTEYKVLIKFWNRSSEIWSDNKQKIQSFKNGLWKTVGPPWSLEYIRLIGIPLEDWKRLTDEMIRPDWPLNKALMRIHKEVCETGDETPLTMLKYLHDGLVTSCPDVITPAEAQNIADHQEYLLQVLFQFEESYDTPDPTRASVKDMKPERTCLLRELIYSSNFDYATVRDSILLLKQHLIELSYISGVCADYIYQGESKSSDSYNKNISDTITEISSFTSKWINESLPSSWPSAHNQILRQQVMENTREPEKFNPKIKEIDNEVMKKATNQSHLLLINMGFPKYVYETLIMKAPSQSYEIYFEGKSDYCSHSETKDGIDTVICRIPLHLTDEKEKSRFKTKMQRLKDYAEELNYTIQYEMENLYDAANLTQIAGTLKEKFGKEFVTEHDFHGWAIVRQWSPKFWNKCPTIDYYASFYDSIESRNITSFSYINRGWFYQKCEHFRFFFFG